MYDLSYLTPHFKRFETLLGLKPQSCSVLPPFMYLGPEPDDVITVETVENHSTLSAIDTVAQSALSLGTGPLYISNGLRCVRRQNQRASLVLDHHIILNPDTHAAETLWGLLIVLGDVQP